MAMKTRNLVSAAVMAFCLAPLHVALSDNISAAALPEAQTQNGVQYLSGGVGKDQVQALQQAARDYSLMLTFAAQKSGDFIADVNVKIADKSGKPVMDAVADGPMMLVKLPPGQYKISAASNDRSVTKSVHVSDNRTTRVTLYWPDKAVE